MSQTQMQVGGALQVGAATHVGAVRDHNEDAILTGRRVFAVADGMGGHAAGEIASALALARVRGVSDQDDLQPGELLTAIDRANEDIVRSAATNPEQAGMGTTIAGIGVVTVGGADHWAVFNVGDSRVYRLADGILTQLTVDHSEVEELIASGEITPSEARSHPMRNVITRSLGSVPAPQPDSWVFPIIGAERFVVCSDGLTTELDDAAIAAVLRDVPNSQDAADELVLLALAAGGKDNISVIVVDHVGHAATAGATTAPRASARDAG